MNESVNCSPMCVYAIYITYSVRYNGIYKGIYDAKCINIHTYIHKNTKDVYDIR